MARLLGKNAKIYFGTTAGAQDLTAGADGFNWEVELEGDREAMESWSDFWESPVHRVARWRGRFEKFITTIALLDHADTQFDTPGTLAYVEFFRGGATTLGASILQGQILFTSARVTSPTGPMLESVEFVGVGAPTTVAAS